MTSRRCVSRGRGGGGVTLNNERGKRAGGRGWVGAGWVGRELSWIVRMAVRAVEGSCATLLLPFLIGWSGGVTLNFKWSYCFIILIERRNLKEVSHPKESSDKCGLSVANKVLLKILKRMQCLVWVVQSGDITASRNSGGNFISRRSFCN